MGHKTHRRRKKHRGAVKQTTPTFQVLIERFESGLTCRKEITRRVLAGPPNKCAEEVKNNFAQLHIIALKEGWVFNTHQSGMTEGYVISEVKK